MRPLLRTRVVLKVICSVDDGNAVVVAVADGNAVVGKKIRGGEIQSGERIPAVVNPSVVGAAELGWNTAPQEQDKPHKVFFDTYL